MAAVFEAEERVTAVHIEGLAVLKIVKHCQESLPQMVTGSLLGLTVGNGILEITHAFPFPEPETKSSTTAGASTPLTMLDPNVTDPSSSGADGGPGDEAFMDGHEFQLEMMKMLREVNVDNNCVGWYQCMYLGSYSNAALVENQLSYQTDLSPNAVVMLYDPMQTAHGNLVLKCFKLTDQCVELKTSGKNEYLDPKHIFEEIPVTFKNPGLVQALLYDVADGRHGDFEGGYDIKHSAGVGATVAASASSNGLDCTFDRLDLSTNPYLEKHLEFLCTWVDDLAAEQHKFQYYTRNLSRNNRNNDKRNKGKDSSNEEKNTDEGWASTDAPKRMESLLISNQIRSYCDQVDKFAGGGFSKLFLTGGLHKEESNL